MHADLITQYPHSLCPLSVGIMCRLSTSPSLWKLQMGRGNSFAAVLIHLWMWFQSRSRDKTASLWMEKPRCRSRVCRSDAVHNLTAKQILHSSSKREMSHTSTHKATLQDQTIAVWQLVMSGGDYMTWLSAKDFNSPRACLPPLLCCCSYCLENPQKTASFPTRARVRQCAIYWWWLCNYVTLSLSRMHVFKWTGGHQGKHGLSLLCLVLYQKTNVENWRTFTDDDAESLCEKGYCLLTSSDSAPKVSPLSWHYSTVEMGFS